MTESPATPTAPVTDLPPALVPELRDAAAPAPVRTLGIHWLFALPIAPFALLFPRTFGPHLAASGWRSAYAAHIFGLLLAMGFFMSQFLGSATGPRGGFLLGELPLLDELRRAAAAVIAILHSLPEEAMQSPADAFAVGLGILIGHGVFWIVALAVLPFFSAGERRLPLYLRTVKLLLWSTPAAILVGMFAPRVIVEFEPRDMPFTAFSLFLVWCLWSLSVILRLGGRYGGPPTGLRWEPAPILCEQCGYALANQPLDGRCPECALAVAQSLPERRRPARLATASPLTLVPAFFATWCAAAFQRDFARRVRVWCDERAARGFAVGVSMLVGAIVGVGGFALALYLWKKGMMPIPGRTFDHKLVEAVAAGVIAFVIGFATVPGWMMLVGLVACRAGFGESLRRGIVICYASAIAPLIAVLGVIGTLSTAWVTTWYKPRPSGIYLPEFGTIDKRLLVGFLLHAPVAVGLILSVLRARRMLRDTRFANA